MKIKSAALILMIASSIWLIDQLYYAYQRFWGTAANYYKDKPVDMVMSTLIITMPIAFLLFSYAVYTKKTKTAVTLADADVLNENMLEVEFNNISVGNWIGIFFVACIPIVGLIFLVVWAIDNEKPIRKNWAIASLAWTVFQVIMIVVLFSVVRRSYY